MNNKNNYKNNKNKENVQKIKNFYHPRYNILKIRLMILCISFNISRYQNKISYLT